MKRLLLLTVYLLTTSVYAQVITDGLSENGCDTIASAIACVANEVKGEIPVGHCELQIKIRLAILNQSNQDYSKLENLISQEMSRVRVTKQTKPEPVYLDFKNRCYQKSGIIDDLMNVSV